MCVCLCVGHMGQSSIWPTGMHDAVTQQAICMELMQSNRHVNAPSPPPGVVLAPSPYLCVNGAEVLVQDACMPLHTNTLLGDRLRLNSLRHKPVCVLGGGATEWECDAVCVVEGFARQPMHTQPLMCCVCMSPRGSLVQALHVCAHAADVAPHNVLGANTKPVPISTSVREEGGSEDTAAFCQSVSQSVRVGAQHSKRFVKPPCPAMQMTAEATSCVATDDSCLLCVCAACPHIFTECRAPEPVVRAQH